MDINSILNNLRTKGLRETLRIRANRSLDPKQKRLRKKLLVAQTLQKYMTEAGSPEEDFSTMEALLGEIEHFDWRNLADEHLLDWNRRLSALEKPPVRHALKTKYLKEILPKAYDEAATAPVTDTIVFLQPRRGLNQSFQYIFHRVEEDYPYTPRLFELWRDSVCITEHYINAERFMGAAARAKAIMVHESNEFLGYVNIRPETKVIQLWHGCGIIKSIGLDNADKPGFKSMADYEEFPEYNKYDLVTIASEELRWVFERFMGLPQGSPVIQATGVSRTDEFFDPEYIEQSYQKLYERIPAAREKKVILYAPTYRGVDPNRTAPDALDIPLFARELSDEYILIIKHHQTAQDLPPIPEENDGTFAWDMTRGSGMNINELMTVADVCISDYSSVVFEYSLFERPILLYLFDMEDYQDARGVYYTCEELSACGPVFRNNEDMVNYLQHLNERFDKSQVTAFRKKYMSACDGHATERIMEFIES